MNSFRFNLQKVLDWRQTQLDLEEARFKQQLAAVAELDRARAALEAAGIHAEVQVRQWRPVAGRDVTALGGYRLHVMAQEQEIAVSRAKSQSALDAQEAAMLEARRRCRLLERLKERRRAEWQAAGDREVEELAAESYLAGWVRGER
ncbi:MAG: hypothetical protein P4L56_12640 [Candidatus Sulfopaludibacter sp.]|nr:hypothetical protein [Candidatus Sulfopaludibacter sp.]